MNVQELIDKLNDVPDKSLKVVIEPIGVGRYSFYEANVVTGTLIPTDEEIVIMENAVLISNAG